MRTVNIPQRGHANTFGSDLFTTRKAFLLLRPIFPGRTLEETDKTFVVGVQSDSVCLQYRTRFTLYTGKGLIENYCLPCICASKECIRDKKKYNKYSSASGSS